MGKEGKKGLQVSLSLCYGVTEAIFGLGLIIFPSLPSSLLSFFNQALQCPPPPPPPFPPSLSLCLHLFSFRLPTLLSFLVWRLSPSLPYPSSFPPPRGEPQLSFLLKPLCKTLECLSIKWKPRRRTRLKNMIMRKRREGRKERRKLRKGGKDWRRRGAESGG